MNIVAHNLLAMNANRQFGIVNKKKAKSTEKLSSGYKINRAADDAAGLSISEKMRRQIRGLNKASENCQDGISLVQVADGALNETQDILQRMNELAVKSANGTNTEVDRQAIDDERKQLVMELNRIANTTTFNEEIYPLLGKRKKSSELVQPMKTISYEDVIFDDIKLVGSGTISKEVADTYVGWSPFENVADYDSLKLQAVIDDKDNLFSQDTYSLIYGDGSTSHSKIRITDINEIVLNNANPEQYEVDMCDFTYDAGSYQFDEPSKTWSRSFSWMSPNGNLGAKVTEKVQIDDANKTYIITNEIEPTGTKLAGFEFIVNLDTAYNNNDRCEGYYTDGNELEKFSIFKNANGTTALSNGYFLSNLDSTMPSVYEEADYPGSISIVNRDFQDMLPFTEKIGFIGDKPVISIGQYGNGSDWWDYFEGEGSNRMLGQNAIGTDRTMSLIWSTGNTATALAIANQIALQQIKNYSFTYTFGVENVKHDTNLPPTPTKVFRTKQVPDMDAPPVLTETYYPDELRIQAGVDPLYGNGIYIHLVDATADTLGVGDVNLSTQEGSEAAIDKIKNAIRVTSEYRSYFGAIQNRMEHTINNLDNIRVNTQEAESRIRDTDITTEMVEFSNLNILQQAGTSMMSFAQQDRQNILSLLQ